MKNITPIKLVVTFDENQVPREAVLLYRMSVDGVTDQRKIYTTSVTGSINKSFVEMLMDVAKGHAELGEGIITEAALEQKKQDFTTGIKNEIEKEIKTEIKTETENEIGRA